MTPISGTNMRPWNTARGSRVIQTTGEFAFVDEWRLKMLKKLMITTALSALLIGSAAAQSTNPVSGASQPTTPQSKETSSPPAVSQQSSPYIPRSDMKSAAASPHFVHAQKSDQWLASKFKGTEVIGSDGNKIGSVSDILFDKDGKIEAYIVGVGGFLGMGVKDVALAPGSFQVIQGDKSKNESDKLKISMNADQLKQAATFEPYNPPRMKAGSNEKGKAPLRTTSRESE